MRSNDFTVFYDKVKIWWIKVNLIFKIKKKKINVPDPCLKRIDNCFFFIQLFDYQQPQNVISGK